MYVEYTSFTDGLIVGFMDQGIAAGIAFALGYARGVLMLLVCVAAFMAWTSRLAVAWIARRGLIAMFVLMLLQVGSYSSYIREPFWTTIPNAIASAMTGGTVRITAAERFDRINAAATNRIAVADSMTNISMIRAQITIAIVQGFMFLFIAASYAVWMMSRIYIALLIAMGPFLLLAAIFDGSRIYVLQWLGKLVSFTVFALCVTALTEMMLQGTMLWVQRTAANTGSLPGVLDGLWKMTIWLFLGAAALIGLPALAAIGSGAAAATATAPALATATAARLGRASSGRNATPARARP